MSDTDAPNEQTPAWASIPADPAESPRPKRVDRWAHRRGEPRLFAFWWATFLLGATLISFSLLGLRPQATLDTYRPAARLLVTIAMAGLVVLWPMVRLSQAHPREGRFPESAMRAVGKDMIVIVVPLLAVVAPQTWLAEWPFEVTLGLCAAAAAWAVLTGALLVIGIETGRRVLTMVVILAIAFAPGVTVALSRFEPQGWVWAISPLTLPSEFTRDRPWTGSVAAITRDHWTAVAGEWVAAGMAWIAATLVSRRG